MAKARNLAPIYFVIYSFILNLVLITTGMVSGRHLEFKKWPQWKSLNWDNSKYIEEESTKIGTNKLYNSILPVGNI